MDSSEAFETLPFESTAAFTLTFTVPWIVLLALGDTSGSTRDTTAPLNVPRVAELLGNGGAAPEVFAVGEACCVSAGEEPEGRDRVARKTMPTIRINAAARIAAMRSLVESAFAIGTGITVGTGFIFDAAAAEDAGLKRD